MILEILFWGCCLAVFHSYVLFPILLRIFAAGKALETEKFEKGDDLPHTYLLMAVYNARSIIEEKLESIIQSDYPQDKLHVLIGSDNSDDGTNEVLLQFAEKYKNIEVKIFENRNGKANIINDIYGQLKVKLEDGEPLLIMTDVYAIFNNQTISKLVRHFKDRSVGLVGANILNGKYSKDGISFQEKAYFSREILMKYQEGVVWGSSAGAFGACYVIRESCFNPVPKNFLVDDFFITFKVLEGRLKAIYDLDAVCYLDVPNDTRTEYNRKVRISAGNFQNLKVFAHMLWPPFSGVAFSFLSHKVFRWLGPFFIFICYLSSFILGLNSSFYQALFVLQTILLLTPFIDNTFRRFSIHLKLLKFVSHFYLMNLGIFVGYIKYKKGIESNVWNPTKRSS